MNQQYTVATSAGGIICLVTTAVLFVLKVIGVITASWWLVLAPLLVWAGLGVAALVVLLLGGLVVAAVAGIIALAERRKDKKRKKALLEAKSMRMRRPLP